MNGRVDPVKAAEPSKPRGSSSSKRPARISDEHQAKRNRGDKENEHYAVFMPESDIDSMIDPALMAPIHPMEGVSYDLNVPMTDVNNFSTPPHTLSTEHSFSTMNRLAQPLDPLLDPALMDQPPSRPDVPKQEDEVMTNQDTAITIETRGIPDAKLEYGNDNVGTPDVDKSFSPITAETSSAEIVIRSGGDDDTPRSEEDSARTAVVDDIPQPSEWIDPKPQPDQRRHSSNATGVSPKQEIMSASSRRSSSQTSGNTHVAASVEQPRIIEANDKQQDISGGLDIKLEVIDGAVDTTRDRRGSTVASSVSDVAADQEFARRLQMEEMGLRRRTSVRAP